MTATWNTGALARSDTKLFEPARLGELSLSNRVIMAPLARARSADPSREPIQRVVTYYRQRASAGLIISEGTHVSPNSVSRPGGSAIHTQGQTRAWREVTEAVHAKGGRIFQQLYHLGRKAHFSRLPGNQLPTAPSAIAAIGKTLTPEGLLTFPTPRALATEEIPSLVEEFRQAAINSRAAGFDGVEVHAANGFLIDQFLRDGANRRQDRYGGSIENRTRFLLEVVDATVGVWGAGRVGVRISPHFVQDGIGELNPPALYSYVAEALQERQVAYLHLIESEAIEPERRLARRLKTFFRQPLILAEGYTRDTAERALAEQRADFVAFGSLFIANPDLVERFRLDAPLNPPDESTYYVGGDEGYIDYPTLAKTPQEA